MNEKDYVTKEVFDSKIDTLLILDEKTNQRVDDVKDAINWHFSVLTITFAIVQIGIGFLLYILTK